MVEEFLEENEQYLPKAHPVSQPLMTVQEIDGP